MISVKELREREFENPRLVAILNTITDSCGACDSELMVSECLQHLICPNPSCEGKLARRVEIMAKAFGIENIGVKVATRLVDSFDFEGLHSLYDMQVEDFMKVEGFGLGMATKLYNSIHSKREVLWEDFIRGIQIRRVGEGTSRELSQKIENLDELLNITVGKMASIMDRLREGSTSTIVKSIQDQKEEILKLSKLVTIIYPEPKSLAASMKDLSHITAVITGRLEFGSRSQFEDKYRDMYGIKFGKSVSGNTDILVTNASSTSSKSQRAAELGVKVMSEKEFVQYVEEL